jgi:hypothetical protein
MEPGGSLLADVVLIVHALFVAFVVLGFVVILWGLGAGRDWARSPWLRGLHVAAIGVVCIEAWAGIACPLTVWESALRREGGGSGYATGFIADRVSRLLYWDAPPWVFTLAYTLFGGLVALAWWLAPPRRGRRQRQSGQP